MLTMLKKRLHEYLDKRVENILSNNKDNSMFNDVLNRAARTQERRIAYSAMRERYAELASMLDDTY